MDPRRRLALVAMAALLTAGCSSAGGGRDATQEPDDTLVIALSDEPTTYNPIFGDLYGSIYGDHWPAFNGLFGYDRRLDLVPELASEMPEISPDGRSVTVNLRDGVTFHDGEALTADDVVFTYRAILDPDVATTLRDELLESLESIEALDERTVRFTLSRHDPAFSHKLNLGIVPEHLLQGKDLNTAEFNKAPVGSGPYVFEELRAGERVVFKANPDYWAGEVGVPRIVYTFIPDENARATQLANGAVDVDAVGLSPRVAQRFKSDQNHRVVEIPGESFYLMLNNLDPVLTEPPVRRALGLAIDRRAIVEGVFAGTARPTLGPFPADTWAALPDPTPGVDLAEARSLLAGAGWADVDGDGILDKGGKRLSFPLAYDTYLSTLGDTAQALRAAFRQIGAGAELKQVPFAKAGESIAAGESRLSVTGNVLDPDLDWYPRYHSGGIGDDDPFTNAASARIPAVDEALERGRQSADREKRRDAYLDLQRALIEDSSYVFLIQYRYQLVVSDDIKGISPQPREGHLHGWSRGLLWNLPAWSLDSA